MKILPASVSLIAVAVVAFLNLGSTELAVAGPKITEHYSMVDGQLRITRSYVVPPDFGRAVDEHTAKGDPFLAEHYRKRPEEEPRQVEAFLEQFGITFAAGTNARYIPKGSQLVVCQSEAQLKLVEAFLGYGGFDGHQRNVTIVVEEIAVERNDLNAWLMTHRLHSDGTELRSALQKKIRAGQAKVIETVCLNARSGQRAKIESVSEYIYPSEIDYDKWKTTEKVAETEIIPPPRIPLIPEYEFETQNVGITLECDPVVAPDGTTVDLNLAVDDVALRKLQWWPIDDEKSTMRLQVPIFAARRVGTQITLIDGHYALVDIVEAEDEESDTSDIENPMVVTFVRADVGRHWERPPEEQR